MYHTGLRKVVFTAWQFKGLYYLFFRRTDASSGRPSLTFSKTDSRAPSLGRQAVRMQHVRQTVPPEG